AALLSWDADVLPYLRDIDACETAFIVDACNSGQVVDTVLAQVKNDDIHYKKTSIGVDAACGNEEEAHSSKVSSNSYFGTAFLKQANALPSSVPLPILDVAKFGLPGDNLGFFYQQYPKSSAIRSSCPCCGPQITTFAPTCGHTDTVVTIDGMN